MKSATQLTQLGKEVSSDYLNKNIDMTKSLEKLANQQGLNKNELSRVAEAANVETYLELIKKASDEKYIEFPVADYRIALKEDIEKEAEYAEDYNDITYDAPEFFKVAGQTEEDYKFLDSNSEHIKQAQRLTATVDYTNNIFEEEKLNLYRTFDKLAAMCKQHVLEGNDYSDIDFIVKEAAQEYGDQLSNGIKSYLPDWIPFTKVANLKINKESKLYKEASNFLVQARYIEKIGSALIDCIDVYNNYILEYKVGSIEKYAAALDGVKKLTGFIGRNKGVAGIVGGATAMALVNEGKKTLPKVPYSFNRPEIAMALRDAQRTHII